MQNINKINIKYCGLHKICTLYFCAASVQIILEIVQGRGNLSITTESSQHNKLNKNTSKLDEK